MTLSSIAERKAALQEQLAKIEQEEQQQREKRSAILGRVIDAELSKNPDLQKLVFEALERNLKKANEREMFGLPKLATTRGRPKQSA
mgnify:CR=1 FL=1